MKPVYLKILILVITFMAVNNVKSQQHFKKFDEDQQEFLQTT